MASTWSNLKFELIGTGDQSGTWGATTNDNLGIAIEQAIGGKADVTMSSTTITLTLTDTTALQDARALYLNLTGTPGGAATLNVPAVQKAYIVYNNTTGGFAVTVKVSGQTGVSVPNGKSMLLYDNGTDVVDAVTHLSSLTLGSALPIGSGGTGAASLTANNVILGNGTSAVQFVAPGSNGNVLTSNGTTWTSAAAGVSLSGQTDSATPFETALGYQAGNANTGVNNTFIGYQAGLVNSTGTDNTAIGMEALDANTTGNYNVAIGRGALTSSTTASDNTAVGYSALGVNTGAQNTAVGRIALYLNSSGTQNTAVGYAAGGSLTTGSNNIVIGYNADVSSATVSNEVTIGNTSITSTRLRGMVQLNAAMLEQATVSATAATGTINFDARTQSVLYYTSNASANWTLNVRGASGVSLDSIMSTGQSLTIAFLVTNGATAYYQSGFQVDSVSVTPKWQGGTAPTSGNANSVDIYAITIVKTGAATFTAFASQTKFA